MVWQEINIIEELNMTFKRFLSFGIFICYMRIIMLVLFSVVVKKKEKCVQNHYAK